MKGTRTLITAFGYGVYSLENVPQGRKGAPPSIESCGLDVVRSIPDPGNLERLFILTGSGLPPSGMENVTPEDWDRLRRAVKRSGDESFIRRLTLFGRSN